MLSEEAIRRALHASRVISLMVPKPNGLLGLEQLTATVAAIRPEIAQAQPAGERVVLPRERPDDA
jgi:hypothetical protein